MVQPLPPEQRKSYIVPDSTYGLLVIESSLPRLSLRSNMPARTEVTGTPGVFMWNMATGTHIVTVMAEGFEALRFRVTVAGRGPDQVQQFRVLEGVTPHWSADPPQVLLRYVPQDPSDVLQARLDDNPLWLDFSKGAVLLEPEVGPHRIWVAGAAGVWEQSFTLSEANRRPEWDVHLDRTKGASRSMPLSGTFSVVSEPAGAKVLLNHAVVGQTPLRLENVPPGQYQLTLLKKNYVPFTMGFDIDSSAEAAVGGHTINLDFPVFPLIPRFGVLRIASVPPGAQVYLDGAPKGITPLDSIAVNPGQKSLRLELPQHYAYLQTLYVGSDTTIALTCSLQHHKGRLRLASIPPDAEVFINGRLLGRTPIDDSLATDTYKARLRKPGYSDHLLEVPIVVDRDFEMNLLLEQHTAALRLDSWPHDAVMTVSGPSAELESKTYRTPTSKIRLLSGQYLVKLSLPKHDDRIDTLWLGPGVLLDTLVDLRRQAGTLELVMPEGGGAEVLLEGETKLERTYPPDGSPLIVDDVPTGTYELTIRKKGFKTYRSQVIIQNNTKSTLRPTLFR
ncbi:MAG: PEGA domain-containing protein [bacterium]|nr:PEGA domain-containing protein [bacterium]